MEERKGTTRIFVARQNYSWETDLLVSVLEDGRQAGEELRDGGLHLAHTDHVYDRLSSNRG